MIVKNDFLFTRMKDNLGIIVRGGRK